MSGGFPASAVATGRWRAGLAAPAIAAPLIAASVLTPQGVTAGIQADPVCLPVTAQPGHSYPLTVTVANRGGAMEHQALAVTPAHNPRDRSLNQVPASWVAFAEARVPVYPHSATRLTLTLGIPAGARPGAYWSDIETSAGAAAATDAIVFTVGPSATPPPPCAGLDDAQYTGKFPAWPTKAFATTGWKQVYASQEVSERAAHTAPTAIPTAGTGASAADPAPPMSPAANQAPSGSPKISSDWPGYLVIAGIILLVLVGLRRWLKS